MGRQERARDREREGESAAMKGLCCCSAPRAAIKPHHLPLTPAPTLPMRTCVCTAPAASVQSGTGCVSPPRVEKDTWLAFCLG